jgi:hypothetical protein
MKFCSLLILSTQSPDAATRFISFSPHASEVSNSIVVFTMYLLYIFFLHTELSDTA